MQILLKKHSIAIFILLFIQLNTVDASSQYEDYWGGINGGIFYPPSAIMGMGISLGYKNNVILSYDVGGFIHTSSSSLSVSSYSKRINISKLNLSLSLFGGFLLGKVNSYQYSDATETNYFHAIFAGLGIFSSSDTTIFSYGYSLEYRNKNYEMNSLPMIKLTFKSPYALF